jgi:hypothetical protein
MFRFTLALAAALFSSAAAPAQDDKLFKLLTPEQTEELLESMKIDFKKTPAQREGIFYYDLKRQGASVRFYLYEGKDIMLDAIFPGLPLEKINEWNVRAKFSRACLHKDAKGDFTALEANLDIVGGVSVGTIKQFILTFDEEIKSFVKFAGSAAGDDAIYTRVTPEKIEKTLADLGIQFKKIQLKGPVVAYEYEANNHKLRLTNFGGADLMIDAQFKKLPLETVNEYNLKRKFIRAVAYNLMGNEYTALESNLDCLGGISDGILRHFIRAFDEEVKEFTKFVKSK